MQGVWLRDRGRGALRGIKARKMEAKTKLSSSTTMEARVAKVGHGYSRMRDEASVGEGETMSGHKTIIYESAHAVTNPAHIIRNYHQEPDAWWAPFGSLGSPFCFNSTLPRLPLSGAADKLLERRRL